MNRRTAEWVEKAEEDFLVAQSLAAQARPRRSIVSFHCQQAAEKYVKALLQELGLAVPRTHDLEHLLDLAAAQMRYGVAAFVVMIRNGGESSRPMSWELGGG